MKSNNINKEVELFNCTHIRTILMVCVVLYHCLCFWKSGWFVITANDYSYVMNILLGWLNKFHIFGFVLVSGYVFGYIRYETTKYNDIKLFIKNKFRRFIKLL